MKSTLSINFLISLYDYSLAVHSYCCHQILLAVHFHCCLLAGLLIFCILHTNFFKFGKWLKHNSYNSFNWTPSMSTSSGWYWLYYWVIFKHLVFQNFVLEALLWTIIAACRRQCRLEKNSMIEKAWTLSFLRNKRLNIQ